MLTSAPLAALSELPQTSVVVVELALLVAQYRQPIAPGVVAALPRVAAVAAQWSKNPRWVLVPVQEERQEPVGVLAVLERARWWDGLGEPGVVLLRSSSWAGPKNIP